ncbi:globin [Curtobacterium ammoniigenes]|uniref:globin n=1 Tax=Curtobacterium ammoniigenes TaxID=395387 RepID=UPI0009FB6DD9|nr:globin [Curtobacterium ammoniigenes]
MTTGSEPTREPTEQQPLLLRSGLSGPAIGGSLYERIGGAPAFDRLVRTFYQGIQSDPLVWPMYPADDLEGAIERLSLFLQQYWGGPTTYSERRGHPRLRMRHHPFPITPEARDRWLVHMRTAVESLALAPLDEAELWAYLDRAAHAMVNSFDR